VFIARGCGISTNNEQPKESVLESQRIKSIERAKRLLISPVHSLRGIRAYDELQIVVTEVGQVRQTVTALYQGSTDFQKFRSHPKILGVMKVKIMDFFSGSQKITLHPQTALIYV